jgi:hypothetical protein
MVLFVLCSACWLIIPTLAVIAATVALLKPKASVYPALSMWLAAVSAMQAEL